MRRRVLAGLAALALGIGMLAAGAAGPAAAARQSVAKYVALGDSIAAGQGGGAPLDACVRTDGGYAAQLDASPKFNLLRNAACSGATVADVQGQLTQVNRGTTVVTLTVGANDLGLAELYAQCAAIRTGGDPVACLAEVQGVVDDAPGLVAPLATLIGQIALRAPSAAIVVTGYPHLLEPVDLGACVQTAPIQHCLALSSLAFTVNGATDALDAAVQQAVAAAAAQGAQAAYADVVPAFLGHGVQLLPTQWSDRWFGVDPVNDPSGFLHPTYAGYTAYTGVILEALGR
ncbi:SGNH/GDSL hydrolase family protein [Microbacterium kyungheense]|uniref:GDSL-like lipase/acylhydrolase family protein n=1 Tax=Microbacterium kyungheense TaxID=1263636 RepID=A0A543ES06_9MICO|nr:SGNH/GDSL hydrolase family protein [Microbacterium kyungheense]TQM24367.1 GDSL-like lipase/acylhydrolase family protein [Microbacterium kyungheense]